MRFFCPGMKSCKTIMHELKQSFAFRIVIAQPYSQELFRNALRYFNGIMVTGPNNPDGNGSQPDASNNPSFAFSFLLAGMLML